MWSFRPLPTRALVGALAALVLLAWWPVVDCGFVWDDDDHVTHNPVLRTWGGLWQAWTEPRSLPQYYPLVHTTFWLEFRLWGLHPLGYHVVNVALHATAAVLLWRLGRRLALPGAWLAAAWFVVHPVHVESVAWVTERKNVLSLVCALAAALAWLRWRDGGGGRARYWCGGAWFVAALLAKTVVASLPAALLVVAWWRDGRIARRDWRAFLPWLALGAAFGLFTAHLEATHVGAADEPWQLQGAERLLVAGRAPWFYLGSLLWPVGTCFNYPRWSLASADLAAWAWPAATGLALAAAFALRRRCGRGPLAVLLLFGGTLVPALGFFDVYPFRYAFVADHFQYHASVPVLLGLSALWWRAVVPRVPWAVALGVPALVLAGCVVLTLLAIPRYRDLDALWRDTLVHNPDSTLALANLGTLANVRGDHAAARELLERCLALDPRNHEAMINLGVAAHRTGERAAARRWYERALALRPADPGANNNLAVLHLEDGRARDALPYAERAVAADARYVEGRSTLGWALHDLGQWQRALGELDHVLQRAPGDLPARRRAALCLLRLGRVDLAASNALVCLQAEPASTAAHALAVEALAALLRAHPVDRARPIVASACQNHRIAPERLLPALIHALRAAGDDARADALAGG